MRGRQRKTRRGVGVGGWLWRLALLVLVWLVGVAAYIVWVGQRDDAGGGDLAALGEGGAREQRCEGAGEQGRVKAFHGVSFDGSRWVCGHGGNATEARR